MKPIVCIMAISAALLVSPVIGNNYRIQEYNRYAINEVHEEPSISSNIKAYLESKGSPLAEEIDYLLTKKNWDLLIAISSIESGFCVHQRGFNCWGIGGDYAYRKYSSLRESIDDADNLLNKWQENGRWLTVEDMNGSYVYPRSDNWEMVVKKTLNDLNQYGRRSPTIPR